MSLHSEIVRDNGVLKISINGKLHTPLSFKSFRANPRNVSEFYQAGVRLFSVLSSGVTSGLGVPYSRFGESWIGDGEYDFDPVDRQMDMFIENAPDGYFAPMIQLDTREWYIEKHGVPNSFTCLSQIACDETWKRAAADYMKAMIAHIEEKYGDRVYGYFLLCGTTTEWFSEKDYEVANDIKNAGYKKWCNDETAELPAPEAMNRDGDVFLSPEEDDVRRARRFHHELISDLILYFSAEAQSLLQHNKLLGMYYGYIFELSEQDGQRLYNVGGLDYERVLLSPDINMISSPSSYYFRKMTDPSAFMVAQKTLDAHGKLYYLEFDHRTHTCPPFVNEPVDPKSENGYLYQTGIPGFDSRCRNETESVNLMYRDFILSMANGAALWWFDMFDGWFRSEGMMNAVAHMIQLADQMPAMHSASEVAVFVEGLSLLHTRKTSQIPNICLNPIRRTLAECGAPYDLYSIGDLALPEMARYKMYIFLNQYDISEAERAEIDEKCRRDGKTVLWLFAPDYAHGGRTDLAHLSACAHMQIAQTQTTHGALLYDNAEHNYPLHAPYFSIEDPNATVLARFADGTAAVAETITDGVRNVYCATCNLPSALLREILYRAGVFVYSDDGHVYTYVNSGMIGVYNATEHDAVIHVPADGVYTDRLTGEKYAAENGTLTLAKRTLDDFILVHEG